MDQIAAALRMSKRTLYELFPNKEELLAACLKQIQQKREFNPDQRDEICQEPLLFSLYVLQTAAFLRFHYSHLIRETEIYYPEVHAHFQSKNREKMKELIMNILHQADERGDLRPNLDFAVIEQTLCDFMVRRQPAERGREEQELQQIGDACYNYLRGLLSIKAIERYDQNEQRFRKILEHKEYNQ